MSILKAFALLYKDIRGGFIMIKEAILTRRRHDKLKKAFDEVDPKESADAINDLFK